MELKVISFFSAGGITFGLGLIKQLLEKIYFIGGDIGNLEEKTGWIRLKEISYYPAKSIQSTKPDE